MSFSAVLEKITTRRAKAEAKSIDSYRQLVVALADDEDVDPARADALLLDAAKTPAALEADVEKVRQRRADMAIAAPLADLRREYDEAHRVQVSIREARIEFERQEREKEAANARRRNEVLNKIRACEEAIVRLKAGRPDPREVGLRSERNELLRKRDGLREEIGPPDQTTFGLIGALLSRKKALAAGPQPHVGEFPGPARPSIVAGLPYDEVKLQAEIDLAELRVRDLQGQLKKIEGRLAEVNATLAEIEAQQLSAD